MFSWWKWKSHIQYPSKNLNVSEFVAISDEVSGHFPAMLEATNLDIFDKMVGHFPAVFVATRLDILNLKSGHFPAVLVSAKLNIF